MIGRLMQSAIKRMAKACGMFVVPRSGRLSLETSLEKWAGRNIGGVASDKPFDSGDIEVPAITIDHVMGERGLPGP